MLDADTPIGCAGGVAAIVDVTADDDGNADVREGNDKVGTTTSALASATLVADTIATVARATNVATYTDNSMTLVVDAAASATATTTSVDTSNGTTCVSLLSVWRITRL